MSARRLRRPPQWITTTLLLHNMKSRPRHPVRRTFGCGSQVSGNGAVAVGCGLEAAGGQDRIPAPFGWAAAGFGAAIIASGCMVTGANSSDVEALKRIGKPVRFFLAYQY